MEIKSIKKKIQNRSILCSYYLGTELHVSSEANYLFKKKCILMGPLTISFKASGQRAGTFRGGPIY